MLRSLRLSSLPVLAAAVSFSATAHAAQYLPPVGFTLPVQPAAAKEACPPVPPPYTGALRLRSKYEGSDAARATLNKAAEEAYRDSTRTIDAMERQVSKLVQRGDSRCAILALDSWARAGALTSTDTSHTGRSVRKWALASFSSAWIQLKFAPHSALNHDPAAAEVEHWLSQLGTLTARDWRGLPLSKINNHSYWAGWALMSTAIVTGRDDLFDDAVALLRTGLAQVDARGFLPNELKRRQRALAYHNYALQPLVMLALFARANHVALSDAENAALKRLGERVIAGFDDPTPFREATGSEQDRHFLDQPTNLAWLEAWCSLYTCPAAVNNRLAALRPLNNVRLGGNLSRLTGQNLVVAGD